MSKPKSNSTAIAGSSLATCSPFDLYATAALTGLLSNPTIMGSLGLQSYLQGNGDAVPAQVVGAALRYAEIAMELRQKIQENEQSPSVDAKEKANDIT